MNEKLINNSSNNKKYGNDKVNNMNSYNNVIVNSMVNNDNSNEGLDIQTSTNSQVITNTSVQNLNEQMYKPSQNTNTTQVNIGNSINNSDINTFNSKGVNSTFKIIDFTNSKKLNNGNDKGLENNINSIVSSYSIGSEVGITRSSEINLQIGKETPRTLTNCGGGDSDIISRNLNKGVLSANLLNINRFYTNDSQNIGSNINIEQIENSGTLNTLPIDYYTLNCDNLMDPLNNVQNNSEIFQISKEGDQHPLSTQINSKPTKQKSKSQKPNLTNEERTKIYELLYRDSLNGRIQRGALGKLSKQFNVTTRTISRIWDRGQTSISKGIDSADVKSLIQSKTGRKPKALDLSKVSKLHPSKRESLAILSKYTGIPKSTLYRAVKNNLLIKQNNYYKIFKADKLTKKYTRRFTGIRKWIEVNNTNNTNNTNNNDHNGNDCGENNENSINNNSNVKNSNSTNINHNEVESKPPIKLTFINNNKKAKK